MLLLCSVLAAKILIKHMNGTNTVAVKVSRNHLEKTRVSIAEPFNYRNKIIIFLGSKQDNVIMLAKKKETSFDR